MQETIKKKLIELDQTSWRDRILRIDSRNPDLGKIGKAAAIIQQGGVVAFPASCLYGLGTDALNASAVERIFRIKQRPADKPILVLVKDREQVNRLARKVPLAAEIIMAHFWPGRVTIVFEARSGLPARLTAGSGKIGIRMAGHPVSAALVRMLKNPMTGTSANLSAEPGCCRISEINPVVARQLDLILDAGTLKGGAGSTIVDVTVDPPAILRSGEIQGQEIFRILQKKSAHCIDNRGKFAY